MAPNAETLIVALGDRRYRVERPWGRMPAGQSLGTVSAVAVDSVDRVYVFQRYDALVRTPGPAISVFDSDGTWLASWGAETIKDAHHLFIDDRDRVFLVDRDAHQVVVCDGMGQVTMRLGERDRPGAPFNHPTSVAVGPQGDIYVADGYGGTEVHRFSSAGTLLRSWGTPGKGPSEFTTPHGIWALPDGRVLVGDRENDRLQVFDRDGEYLTEWTGFYHPMVIWGDDQGRTFVSDQVPRLTMVDGDGKRIGACRPVLNGGHGLYGDTKGNLFLAEYNPSRVTKMTLLD